MNSRLGIGVDIGASRVRVCVGSASGKILWRESRPMPSPSRVEDYVHGLIAVISHAVVHVPGGKQVTGIGVASAGPLDLKRGGMASPANLPYDFVPIVKPLADAFGVRVALMNDANAAALGERRFGAGRRYNSLVYVTLSTGIGGGAIVDDHLLSGKDGNAAEIGHAIVDSKERLTCGCGGKGHWEAYCSGRNIPKFAELIASEVGSTKRRHRPLDSAAVFEAAARGNSFEERVVKEVGKLNALGIANAVNMFDPWLVTIGGGVALNNPEMILRPIRNLVPRYSVNRVPQIRITPLGDDAGLLGALLLAIGEHIP